MKRTLFAAALFAAISTMSTAHAGQIRDGGITADEVAQVLQAKGFKAEITKDSSGDPLIKSAADGTRYSILFYGCKHTARCSAIQFYAGFHLDKGMTTDKINDWNRENRFGRAYIDKDRDPNIEMDLDVEHGFLTEGLANNLDTWGAVVPAFKKFIGF